MVWGSGPGQLVRGDTAPTDLHQGRQLDLVVGRAQVLDDLVPTPFLDRDLHRRGPRSGPDLAQKRAHTSAPYGLLVPRHQTPNTATPTKTQSQNPPKCHESDQVRQASTDARRPGK